MDEKNYSKSTSSTLLDVFTIIPLQAVVVNMQNSIYFKFEAVIDFHIHPVSDPVKNLIKKVSF